MSRYNRVWCTFTLIYTSMDSLGRSGEGLQLSHPIDGCWTTLVGLLSEGQVGLLVGTASPVLGLMLRWQHWQCPYSWHSPSQAYFFWCSSRWFRLLLRGVPDCQYPLRSIILHCFCCLRLLLWVQVLVLVDSVADKCHSKARSLLDTA